MMETGVWQPNDGYVHNGARDSLSPKGSYSFQQIDKEAELVRIEDEVEPRASGRHSAKHEPTPASRLNEQGLFSDTSTIPSSTMTKQTCLPRSSSARTPRPFTLELDDSRGATSLRPSELRQLIRKTTSGASTLSSRIQVVEHTSLPSPFPVKGRKKYPRRAPLIGTTIFVRQTSVLPPNVQRPGFMGNQHSHANSGAHTLAAASPSSIDESSTDSIVHSRQRNKPLAKRGSINVLKKKVTQKAGPAANLLTTVIEVPRAATAPNLDLIEDDERNWVDEKENRHIRHQKTLSAPSPALLSHPASPATITERRPLSAGTTITQVSVRSDDDDEQASPVHLRVSALSPSIPTPTPLPEDSPHQYGLKDFVDTPSPRLDSKKNKRFSNGVDIFNEAKSLQSTTSFLNGLSNARRRAESRARSTRSTTEGRLTSASTGNLPYDHSLNEARATPAYRSLQYLASSEPPSPTSTESRPLTPKLDDLSRTLGHTHKSSGFAYAKPLSVVQLKCYRSHDRLLRSGNQLYQVECAVCHQDESGNYYWSCSWCALRMCEDCRTALRTDGTKALKERIRNAEFGAQL